jgi:hypothetical protein
MDCCNQQRRHYKPLGRLFSAPQGPGQHHADLNVRRVGAACRANAALVQFGGYPCAGVDAARPDLLHDRQNIGVAVRLASHSPP